MIKTTVRRGGMKLLTIFMCVAIAITFMPGVGLLDADESHAAGSTSGTIGQEYQDGDIHINPVPWELDENGVLVIGNGEEGQIAYEANGFETSPLEFGGSPFDSIREDVKKIRFSGEVNFVGSGYNIFKDLTNLEEFDATGLRLGDPVNGLGKGFCVSGMFYRCSKIEVIDLRGTGLFENWQCNYCDWAYDDSSHVFYGCTNLKSLKFDFDEDILTEHLKHCTASEFSYGFNLGGAFVDCPNLKSYDVIKLLACGHVVPVYGYYDGGPIGDRYKFAVEGSPKIAECYYDEYAPFYKEKLTPVVDELKNQLNEVIPTMDKWTANEKIPEAIGVSETFVQEFITIDEYEELQRIRSEAAAVLAQDPFPYSQDVKERLETIVENIGALNENSTKQDAQEIIADYNQYNRLVTDSFKAKLNNLPSKDEVRKSHEEYISAVRSEYRELTDAQKALIKADELQKLEDAETGLTDLKTLFGALEDLVDEASLLKTDIYTEASVVPFTQAIDAAETLLGGDPKKAEVDAARLALEDAIRNLKTKETQDLEDAKAELGRLIENARTLDSDLLTDESKADLEAAIGEAQGVYDNPDATKNDLDAAIEALNQAIEGLNGLADYRQAAKKELHEYKNHDDYSEAGKTSLNEIGNAFVAEINTKTSEADIDAAVIKAKADMDAVKTKAEEEFDQAKADLDKAIKDAEDKLKDKDKYTDDTVKDLEDALNKAKETVNNPDATKDDLEKAKKDLDDAIKDLKEKDTGGNSNNDPSKDPNKMGEDGTALGKGASAAAADKAITNMPNDKDPAGSKIMPLKLKSKKQTKSSAKISWSGAVGAAKYVVYGNECGDAKKMQKLTTVTGKSFNVKKLANGKKLRKGKYHKFIVVALDSKDMVVSTSKVVHVVTKGGKNGNHKSVKVSNAKKFKKGLKQGKSLKIKGKAVGKKVKKHVKLRYESSNPAVATVSASGKVKAVGKGSATIIVYAQNGVSKNVKVKVK